MSSYTPETASLPSPGVLAPKSLAPMTSQRDNCRCRFDVARARAAPRAGGVCLGGHCRCSRHGRPATDAASGRQYARRSADGTGADARQGAGGRAVAARFRLCPAAARTTRLLSERLTNQLPPASQALTLTVDYSRIPMAQVGDVRGRLALYRATGCGQASPDLAAGTVSDTTEAEAAFGVTCAQWEKLPTQNDYADQLLSATLPDVEIVAPAPAPPLPLTNEPVSSVATLPETAPNGVRPTTALQ